MKIVRLEYPNQKQKLLDVKTVFGSDDLVGDLTNAATNSHGHHIDETTLELLVPDNFDPSVLKGKIVRPDPNNIKHEWLGHGKQTPYVVDKKGRVELIR